MSYHSYFSFPYCIVIWSGLGAKRSEINAFRGNFRRILWNNRFLLFTYQLKLLRSKCVKTWKHSYILLQMLTFGSDICHPTDNAMGACKTHSKVKMWQLFHLLESYKKSKQKIRITKWFLGPNTWAKSVINWLTAKIHFTLFCDDTANENKWAIGREVWDGTENYFFKLSI